MLASSLAVVALLAGVSAQGPEYLPPNKGYNYQPPSVPFEGNQSPNKQPAPRPAPRPPAPAPQPTRPNYGPPPPPQEHHDDHHHEPGMPFDFAYAVNENGNDFSHNAASDGDVTRGEYRVVLPDGRTQIVKYTADWKNGFNAEVMYEGEARYPEPGPQGYGNSAGGQGQGQGSGPGQQYVPPQQGGGYKY